jgi:hypothetical protein
MAVGIRVEVEHHQVMAGGMDHQAIRIIRALRRGAEKTSGIRRARGDVGIPPGSEELLHPDRFG